MDSDALVAQLIIIPENQAVVGDVVVFNWDNSDITGTWWDHAGIIVEIDETNPKNWLIVSSIGIIEIFNWGTKKTRLGVFGSTNGGEFSIWRPDYENWTFEVYGKNF